MTKPKVLFVCIHNSARSQMAEAWCRHLFEGRISAESAGLEPGVLNPLVVDTMQEEGIDISGNSTKSVFDLFTQGHLFSHVITVCDKEAAERCPIFPGVVERLNWSFKDPSALEGADEERREQIRAIRDEIRRAVEDWGRALLAARDMASS